MNFYIDSNDRDELRRMKSGNVFQLFCVGT
jgi:hypothetical protein